MKWTAVLFAATLAGVTTSSLAASTIFGTFNIAGTVTATDNTIDWVSNVGNVPMQATIGPGATGSFAGLDGTTVTISNLNRATEPIGSSFSDQVFITFDANPSLPALELNFIFAGINGVAGCTAAPPAAGQQCTPGPPITPAASPFNFVNNNGVPTPQATATWALAGDVAGNPGNVWDGNFTSQFGVPFQTVLAEFAAPPNSVSNTYSATFTVAGSTVPETSSWSLVGLGFALIAISRIPALRRRKQQS
jgi:hypothetical protein